MTKDEAIEEVRKTAGIDGDPGDLTTGVCSALGIPFDSFLQYAQLDAKGQKRVIKGLALALLTEKLGHCSQ